MLVFVSRYLKVTEKKTELRKNVCEFLGEMSVRGRVKCLFLVFIKEKEKQLIEEKYFVVFLRIKYFVFAC